MKRIIISMLLLFATYSYSQDWKMSFEEAKSFVLDFVKPDYNNWEGNEEFEARFMEIVEKKFN